ncbi:DNA internalization-related competence protein ComEC/Rec2, partial [hydrothermal vent metagenome]
MAVGILFGRAHDVSAVILATGCGVCFLAFIKKDFAQFILCLLFFLLGFSLIWIHDNKALPPNDVYHFVSKKRVDVTFKIAATESERAYNTRYLVEIKSVNGKSVTGYARWYAPQKVSSTLLPGDVLHLTNVKIKKPSSYRNIGGFDYDQYLKNRGITAIITTAKKTVVTHVETTFSWRRPFEKVKNSIKQALYFDDKMVTAIARAMLIGDQGFISPEARTAFSRAGSAHLLAVSGLHVGFISATVYFAVKAFMFLVFYNAKYEWTSAGHPSRIAAIFAIICVLAFAVMTGPRVSSARAAIMVATYLAAIFLGRGRDFYGAFAVAGIIILIGSPWSIFEAGFQLSFSAVFFIVVFMERWWKPVFESNQQMFFKPPPGARVLRNLPYFGSFAAVSVFATMGSAPIAAYHFNVIPLYGVFLNTFLVPVASLAVPWGLFWAFVPSAWAMQVTQTVMRFIWDMTKLTADAPFSHYQVGDISASSVVLYYLFILLSLFMKPSIIKKRLAVSVAIVFIATVSIPPLSSAFNSRLKIMFVDVGQGDCTVVIWPKGGAMVIDAGGRYRTFDPGRSVIAPLLWSEQRTKLTALVVTHSDRDHM